LVLFPPLLSILSLNSLSQLSLSIISRFSSLDVLDEEKFWKGNTQFLANQNISCELNKSSDLRNLFLGPGTLGRKKRLIFWDEFDSLLTNPNLWNQVLQALREIHEFHKAEPNSLFQVFFFSAEFSQVPFPFAMKNKKNKKIEHYLCWCRKSEVVSDKTGSL